MRMAGEGKTFPPSKNRACDFLRGYLTLGLNLKKKAVSLWNRLNLNIELPLVSLTAKGKRNKRLPGFFQKNQVIIHSVSFTL
jgi:hypothetical protein